MMRIQVRFIYVLIHRKKRELQQKHAADQCLEDLHYKNRGLSPDAYNAITGIGIKEDTRLVRASVFKPDIYKEWTVRTLYLLMSNGVLRSTNALEQGVLEITLMDYPKKKHDMSNRTAIIGWKKQDKATQETGSKYSILCHVDPSKCYHFSLAVLELLKAMLRAFREIDYGDPDRAFNIKVKNPCICISFSWFI